MILSIIIPVFNEEKTILPLLKSLRILVLTGWEKELIVVDDGSTDNTLNEIKKYHRAGYPITLVCHKNNLGKGAAVRSGIRKAKGEYIIVQDADLEYHTKDILRLAEIISSKRAKVVYGTRLKRLPNFRKDERSVRFFLHYIGNKALSFFTSILYGQWITDMETGYKLFPREAVESMKLYSRGFEFEPEITAKLLKKGYTIYEVPISTNPRGYKEGKKLHTVRDGIKAFIALVRYRLVD